MKTLSKRIDFLGSQREVLEEWVGKYDEAALRKWLRAELGDEGRLEGFVDGSMCVPRGPVLHVVSGNTEHAAFQSVFRAILVGCKSWVKVPSAGLPEFEAWAAELDFLDVRRELPEEWRAAEVAVVYGGAETVEFFRNWVSPRTRVIEHGPKLSAAFVFAERDGVFQDLAEDVMRYGQRGCLSVQVIYVKTDPETFCEKLAEALEAYSNSPVSHSQAGAIRNQRELERFKIANGAKLRMWESENSVNWTALLDRESTSLRVGPSGGFVRIVPMPEEISQETLGAETDYLSTAVVEPLSKAELLDEISPPRICAAGRAQEPGIFWHPDGEMPLASLVRWRDLG